MTRRRISVAAAAAVVVAAIGIVNHSRTDHGRPVSAASASSASSPEPSSSAPSCVRTLDDSNAPLLGVMDVWPGSGGGGQITMLSDVSKCQTVAAAPTSAVDDCEVDALSDFVDLSEPAAAYVAGLGVTTVRARQLVHAPLAAVTEIALTAPAGDDTAASQLLDMVDTCRSTLRAGLQLSAAASAGHVVIVEFDDQSLTSSLRARIVDRALALASS